jgi:hypothetical protein
MTRFLARGMAAVAVLAFVAAACSSNSSTPSGTSSSGGGSPSESPPAAIPTAKTVSQPVTYGYYDGHVDTMISTDVTDRAQASSQHINYSAALAMAPPNTFPALYMVKGTAAPHQPFVFSTEPGESDYTPLWNEVTVQWKSGVKPVLLVRDDQVKALAAAGKVKLTPTNIILNCPIVAVSSSHAVPSVTTMDLPAIYGYYDGHVDTMLSTDVTSKAQAKAQNINFTSVLTKQPANSFPALYTVKGSAAPNQPVVFGSEPGESDYSPLWQEVTVRWKPGVTPVTLVKDDQVKEMAQKGQLTMTATPIVLNCPIVAMKAS